ncbi:chloramphenicol resistance protein [Lactobacillus nasalidis]|uniref:Chloramphenicol resistance protein n=1 Tax=Lactobacillus nasalidis TaxID=2797258 RepID=A0ABQ3W2H3_9LACO|nr:MFS transporter [Lactobacillus nasalidis]GHV97304.1 chloramphenicol resistance protein [Lactobacillus nasalidis]GHV99055.1 chloramphenicol resistance protein [Lactobacillus nasalidis]GHW00481.1 chloramphenicol resistance protein [Lactobacillus nasalidis]
MAKKINTKFALFALAATFFGIGVTEFISVGVLPAVAKEFSLSSGTAGLITTIYALGVALGAPVLTLLTAGIPKKKVIVSAIIVFVLGHLLIAGAPTFGLVLLGRFVAGAAHGLLFALSSTIAAALVGPSKQTSAIAYIFGGFPIATAIGAPLGTSVSDIMGWRIPFLLIALLGMIALALNLLALPKMEEKNTAKPSLRTQLSVFTQKHLMLTLIVTILGYGGTFATFTYLSLIVQQVTGVSKAATPLVLLVYGVAIAAGNSLGGRLGGRKPVETLLAIFAVQAVALFAFYFSSVNLLLTMVNIVVLGLLAFMSVPLLQSYILSLAGSYRPEAIEMASSLNITAFNLGIVLGSFVGGQAIAYFNLRATAAAAGIMVVLAVLLALVVAKLENGRQALLALDNGELA